MIELKEITSENIDEVLALKVDKGQKSFVSSNGDSLAQACHTSMGKRLWANGVEH